MGRLVSIFGGIQVAPRLQFLPDFSLLCRAKGLIFFRPNRLRRTHNPLVPGSNPGGPTSVFKKLRSINVQVDFFRLRLGCRRLRICCTIKLINQCNIGTREQMSLGIDGHLYRAMPHLQAIRIHFAVSFQRRYFPVGSAQYMIVLVRWCGQNVV
jgi:hypothetical protein